MKQVKTSVLILSVVCAFQFSGSAAAFTAERQSAAEFIESRAAESIESRAAEFIESKTITLDPSSAGMQFPDLYPGFQSFLQAGDIETDLLNVTSDAMDGSLMLKTVTDSNSTLLELKYVTSGNVVLDMPLEDLAKGVVLMMSGKFEVLKLVGDNLNSETGGNLDLVYLTDGVWNSHKTFPMSLVKSGDHWNFQTREPDKAAVSFTSMYLKKRVLFWKTIGIESVTVK